MQSATDITSRVYPTATSAESAAVRQFRGQWRHVEFLPRTITGLDGGPVYVVRPVGDGYRLVELTPSEVTRWQQSAMRAAVAELMAHAADCDAKADACRPGRNIVGMYRRMAAEARDKTRAIETRLIVSVRGAA